MRRMAIGLAAVRNRFETSPERCGSDVLNKQFSDEWMRRKPLFPPPHNPTTGKRLENKGKQASSVLTINGEIKILRRWWYGKGIGSMAPADEIVNRNRDTVTPGVVEMASRVNLSATSFLRAAQRWNARRK